MTITSIYTITVGAAKYTDEYAPYTTPCTAVMTAAYSSSVEVDLDLRLVSAHLYDPNYLLLNFTQH